MRQQPDRDGGHARRASVADHGQGVEDQPRLDLLLGLMLTMPGLCIGWLALASGWLVDRVREPPVP
ncbi:MAG: hypothetical protein WD118_09600 [Phycisphaeraceae bacterium]